MRKDLLLVMVAQAEADRGNLMFGAWDRRLERVFPAVSVNADKLARLRADQIYSVFRVTPLMMAANVLNAAIIYFYLQDKPGAGFLAVWFAGLVVFAAIGLADWFRKRNRPRPVRASMRGIRNIVRNAVLIAAFWGALPMIMYGNGDAETRLMIVMVAAGMLGGGCIVLYVVPQAMLAWIAVLTAGYFAATLTSGHVVDWSTSALLAIYVISLTRSGYSMWKTFTEARLGMIEIRDQSETIEMLLDDFSENARDWLWETDASGNVVRGSQQFEERLGLKLNAIGPDGAIACGDYRSWDVLWTHFMHHTPFVDVQSHLLAGGDERWLSMSGKPLFDETGRFLGFRGVASDITNQKLAEVRIAELAYRDALTGLVNRATFRAELEKCVASREGTRALFCIDLDGFKPVNDTYGHATGDALLTEIGQRLRRATDEGDIVARLGGDEFAILSGAPMTTASASRLAEKLLAYVSEPLTIGDRRVSVGASIGISFSGVDGVEASTLLHQADLALYRSKKQGKGTYRFFEIAMDEVERQRRLIEANLRQAVSERSLTLNFQPLVEARDGRPAGFEALVRWYHEDHGNVSPADFIPIAEKTGLIGEIGEWVLLEACREASRWPGHLKVSVNLSPQQFNDGLLLSHVRNALAQSGLEPSRLEIEITESLFMENTDAVIDALEQIRSAGVSIALDDFGTGYSSLSYLLKFPFDRLKIDRSFVQTVESDPVAKNVLEAIAKLGRILELSVTAEGVETTEQADMLRAMSVTHLQGFLFGSPLARDEIPAWLAAATARTLGSREAGQAGRDIGRIQGDARSPASGTGG